MHKTKVSIVKKAEQWNVEYLVFWIINVADKLFYLMHGYFCGERMLRW